MYKVSEIIISFPSIRRIMYSFSLKLIIIAVNNISGPHFINQFSRKSVSLPVADTISLRV